MPHWDQGLGTIGLAALATAFGLLLFVGIPIALAPEPVKISDWLGFAGNVLGSGTALIAAAIAWRAVQSQIALQREQLLIGVLIREEDRCEMELRAMRHCIEFIDRAYGTTMPQIGPADRVLRLVQMGLSEDNLVILQTLTEALQYRLDPEWIDEMVSRLEGLFLMAVALRDVARKVQDEDLPKSAWDEALARYYAAVDLLADTGIGVRDRIADTEARREALRGRIEATLASPVAAKAVV